MKTLITAAAISMTATMGFAAGHAMAPAVMTADQSVADGTVSAEKIVAGENGWLVVHRVKANGKPGPVVGHAPLRSGENMDVAAILTETVNPGEKLMLMVHAETGGMKTGIFEYTLGAKEDGPIRVDGKLVMQVIETQ